jgi:hemerythrin
MKIDERLFRVGIPLIDNQHEAYLNLLDDLFAASGEPVINKNRVDEALKKAAVYAMEHFDAEEMLMASYKYPGLEAHRTKHNEFRDGVERLMIEGDFLSPSTFLDEVNKWMLKWFCDQTQVYDRALAEFLKKQPGFAKKA